MQNLNQGILKRMPVAIPPFAEQHRIVAKVDELMALCDEIESALSTHDQLGSGFLRAALGNTLRMDRGAQA